MTTVPSVVSSVFKGVLVQKTMWIVVAVVGVMSLGVAPAHAAATCTLVPSMCPPAAPGSGSKPVPEPASMLVLGAGAAAAALAARRRRKK